MTNGFALFIVVAVIGFFALDHFVLHWDAATHTMRRLMDLIELIAFWR